MVLVLMLLLSSVADAEEFGGWRFTPPAGATKAMGTSTVKLTTIDNKAKTFCQIWLYSVRAPTGDDVNKEWSDLVERAFTIRGASEVVNATVKDMPVSGRVLTIVDGDDAFAAAFYVLQPRGAISSVMLLSTPRGLAREVSDRSVPRVARAREAAGGAGRVVRHDDPEHGRRATLGRTAHREHVVE